MRAFQIKLPDEVAAEAQAAAERLGTTTEEFLARAAADKVREAADDATFDRYAAQFDEDRIDELLARIPDAPPAPGDEIVAANATGVLSVLDDDEPYRMLSLDFDVASKTLWCRLTQVNLTIETLTELRRLQDAVQRSARQETKNPQISRLAFGSKLPNLFGLGAPLELIASFAEKQDRECLTYYARLVSEVQRHNLFMPVPTVAVVEGDALGEAFGLLLSCHVVIAVESSLFGLHEILMGYFPNGLTQPLLYQRLGGAHTKRMVLGGEIYRASDLLSSGLVDMIVRPGDDLGREFDRAVNRRVRPALVTFTQLIAQSIDHNSTDRLAEIWANTILKLDKIDIERMRRLAAAQARRVSRVSKSATDEKPASTTVRRVGPRRVRQAPSRVQLPEDVIVLEEFRKHRHRNAQ